MKYYSVSIVLIYFIETSSVSFAQNGEKSLCSVQFKDDLPAWLLRWKNSDYGLEFTTPPNIDDQISARNKRKEEMYNAGGSEMIKQMVTEHLKNVKKNESQFDIDRLDPIEYDDPSGTKMWLILKNISVFNLDSRNLGTIVYHRKGYREWGSHKLTQDTYENVETLQSSEKKAKQFFKKIDKTNLTYERTDTVWNIKVSARFNSGISSDEKEDSSRKNTYQNEEPVSSVKPEDELLLVNPIVVTAEFKIQPQKNKNESSSNTSNVPPEPLRASGVLTLYLYDFDFELIVIVRHIEQILRENLPVKKRCKNRVPDFDLQYGMYRLDIEKIKLTKYDKDDEWQIEPENHFDDVMDNVSETIDVTDTESTTNRLKKFYDFEEDTSKVEMVKEHLDIIREQILDIRGGEIRKRLCINIMPKMAWKIMQMESNQLPDLIRQIVQYNENFKRKSYLPKASSIGMTSMAKTAFVFGKSLARSSFGIFFSSDRSEERERY